MADPAEVTNNDPMTKFQAAAAANADSMGVLQTLGHGALASVVDLGTTTFNSLTPERFNASTADMLQRINTNTLQVYNEHQDAVQAASFIGGLVAPIGLSIKGMNLLRSGAKGASWFSDAGRAAALTKVDDAYKMAGPVSLEYKAAKNSLYAQMAGNAVADNVAAEAAILMTLNAHPLMEDYQKDLGTNAMLSIALGTGIQSGIGLLTSRSAIRGLTSTTDKELTSITTRLFKANPVSESLPVGVQLSQRSQRVNNLQDYIDAATDPKFPLTLSPITVAGLKTIKIQEEARMVNTFKAAFPEIDTKDIATTTRDFYLNLARQPEFAGVETMSFAKVNLDASAPLVRNPLTGLKDSIKLFTSKIDKKTGETVNTPRDAIYSPVHQAWFSTKEATDYLTIADLNTSIKGLEQTTDKSLGRIARSDQSLNNLVAPSATVEADFAQSILRVSKMEPDELGKMVVAKDDLSMLKAVEARVQALRLEGKDISGIHIKTTSGQPSAKALEVAALRSASASPASLGELRAIPAKQWERYTSDVTVKDLKSPLGASSMVTRPESRALRDTLGKYANPEGYIYLYKSSSKAQGAAVYSFAPEGSAVRAMLYKVHVDDVLGAVKGTNTPQIIVKQGAGTSDEFIKRNAIPLTPTNTAAIPGGKLSVDDISAHLATVNTAEVKAMAKMNMGFETIAARTGTPVEAVRDILSGGVPSSFSKFTSATDIEMALGAANRAVQVSANVDKIPFTQMAANLNDKSMGDISQGIVEFTMKTSPSAFVRGIADDLTTDEIATQIKFLNDGLDNLVPSGVKSSLFRSADSVLEDLGAAGQYATALGKQRINAGNKVIDTITKPMATVFSNIATDAAKMIELNTAININASQSGYRFYRDGKLWSMGQAKEASKLGIDDILGMDDATFQQLTAFKNKAGDSAIDAITYNGKEYSIASKEVQEAFDIMQNSGRDMYHLANVTYKGLGKGELNDIGLWIPAFNVRDKQIAYAFNKTTNQTTMLMANTPEELTSGMRAYQSAQGDKMKNIDLITKANQQAYNDVAGRHDPMYMGVADLSRQKSGSGASAIVSTGNDVMTDVIRGYDSYINRHLDNVFEMQLAPVMEQLKNLSDVSQEAFHAASSGAVGALSKKPVDPGQIIRNVIMGKPNLNQHAAWSEWQQRGQVATDLALKTMSGILSPILSPLTKGLSSTRKASDWTKISAEMEAKGIVNPFQVLDDATGKFVVSKQLGETQFLKQGNLGGESITPRTIALGNALAATSLLRFAELSQPLVNLLSLPILTSAAVRRQFASSLAGTPVAQNPVFSVAATMMDGIRLMNHPTAGQHWDDLANAANLYGRDWQEVNGIMAQSRKVAPGPMSAIENVMESKLVNFMSKPADKSEEIVRRVSFFTGVTLAKKVYPGISDAGVMTFARDFMDKSIGNYTAAQRPAMFQGTFGMGLGLFQTYMLTLAQSMFRQIEQKQFANLGKMMLTQATIFGGGSLPGFQTVSQAIGDHFSDQNIDLTTGTFRAIGDKAASLALYGLPSQLIGISTRGDIQPRMPDPFSGLGSVAAINLTGQVFAAGARVAKAAFSADQNAGTAMLEALSLQSVSRPIARLSELATGVALTQRGNTVSRDTEMYTTQSIISRVFAARPLEEIKARQAQHLNTLYGSLDRDKRTAVTARLKSHLREGDLNPEIVSQLSNEYMRTGSPTGWNSAVNTAIAQVNQPGSATVRNSLNPNSPSQLMINDLDGGE